MASVIVVNKIHVTSLVITSLNKFKNGSTTRYKIQSQHGLRVSIKVIQYFPWSGSSVWFRNFRSLRTFGREYKHAQVHARWRILTLPGNNQNSGCSVKVNYVSRPNTQYNWNPHSLDKLVPSVSVLCSLYVVFVSFFSCHLHANLSHRA